MTGQDGEAGESGGFVDAAGRRRTTRDPLEARHFSVETASTHFTGFRKDACGERRHRELPRQAAGRVAESGAVQDGMEEVHVLIERGRHAYN